MLKQPGCKGLPCHQTRQRHTHTHISSAPPSGAVGACRAAGRGQDAEQTPACSPSEALTAALTRGMTFRFV